MTKPLRHLLGISGGKDSAALALYMHTHYPEINIEYYFCDTGKELDETYQLIDELENVLGKKITKLKAAKNSHKDPFDHYLQRFDGFLPAANARWCTKILKLEPFEEMVGNDFTISYVAIRGDEDREGYISTKPNIQTIFPFRKNIWSLEILSKVLDNENINKVAQLYEGIAEKEKLERILEVVFEPKSAKLPFSKKLNTLLDLGIKQFNTVVYTFLKDTDYPLAKSEQFPLVNNEDIVKEADVFNLFAKNGVTVPKYYKKLTFEVNGQKGEYARSRSGCYFCFFQQKIEWVWLYEQHHDLFQKALSYEKNGYTWMQDESLTQLMKPERIAKIKEDYLKKTNIKLYQFKSSKLVDILADDTGLSCVNCFI